MNNQNLSPRATPSRLNFPPKLHFARIPLKLPAKKVMDSLNLFIDGEHVPAEHSREFERANPPRRRGSRPGRPGPRHRRRSPSPSGATPATTSTCRPRKALGPRTSSRPCAATGTRRASSASTRSSRKKKLIFWHASPRSTPSSKRRVPRPSPGLEGGSASTAFMEVTRRGCTRPEAVCVY